MNPLYPLRDTVSRLRRRPFVGTAPSRATPFAHVRPSSIRPQTSTIRGTIPHLSIAIVADGHHDGRTLRCLTSIVANSPGCEYEILVIEGQTGEPCRGTIAEVPGVRYFTSAEPLSAVEALNTVCRAAEGTFVLQLDPEVELLPGAIDALVAVAERDALIGLVGAKLLTPDGRLFGAGGEVHAEGTAGLEGEGGDPADSAFRYLREVDFVPRGALLVRRSLWTAQGGFDPRMAPAEDIDLALRARESGYRVVYEPLAVMVRHGLPTGTTVLPQPFLTRWAEALRADRDRSAGRQVVLLIDQHLPHAGRGEASTMVLNLVDAFQRMDCVVKFHAADPRAEGEAQLLERRGVECLLTQEGFSFEDWTGRHAAEVDVALLLDAEQVLSAVPLLRQRGAGRIMYFGHELRFARLAAHQQCIGDPSIGTEVLRVFDLERRAWNDADVVLYPSTRDVARVRELVPQAHVQELLPCTFLAPAERTTVPAERTVLFCCNPGTDTQDLHWMLESVLRGVLEQAPETVRWYSNDPDAMQKGLRTQGIETAAAPWGRDLQRAIEGARVVVLPSLDCAEARRARLMALTQGIPVVARDLDGDAQALQVLQLLNDDSLWLTTSRRQATEAAERLSMDRLTRDLTALTRGESDSLPSTEGLSPRAGAADAHVDRAW